MLQKKWNEDWYFWKVKDSFAIGNGIPGNAVRVKVPHDAVLEEKPYAESPNGNNTGFKDSCVYKYAKKLFVETEKRDRMFQLKFEGVYMNALVYVNGQLAAKNMFGYSTFYADLTPFLYFGRENLITVEVRGAMKNSRWYSGAGIYRDVYLLESERCYFAPAGLRVTTLEADAEMAELRLEAVIQNRGIASRECRFEYEILDAEGNIVAADGFAQAVFAGEERRILRKLVLEHPLLWSAETPDLYRCRIRLTDSGDGTTLDTDSDSFGVRIVRADHKRGLRVNGKTVKLRGACIHHDSGLLGSATYDAAQYRQVYKLKEAGFNAIRSSHNPISAGLLRACDALGMYIMEETFDMWTQCKSDFDYALSFSEWWQEDVKLMIAKDYNHPSVIMYSVGNEIQDFGTDAGASFCAKICDEIRSMDDTRLLTSGINGVFMAGDSLDELVEDILAGSGIKPSGTVNDYLTVMDHHMAELVVHDVVTEKLEKLCAPLDVAGYNYMTARYRLDHEKYSDRVMVGSETYPPQIAENWGVIKETSSVIGDFTWTGWDYIGEAGVGIPSYHWGEGGFAAAFPAVLAYCGDIDITGFRRPASHYREIVFGLTEVPYIAVENPHHYGEQGMHTPWVLGDLTASWTWPEMEEKPVVVEVFAAGDEVELLQDGVSLGRKPAGEAVAFRTYFETTYRPGTLVAISYKNGAEAGRRELRSVSGKTELQIEAEDMTQYGLSAEAAEGIQYLSIRNCDESGTVDYNTVLPLRVSVDGDVEWIYCGNGNPRTEHISVEPEFETFEGRAQVIYKKKSTADVVKINIERR